MESRRSFLYNVSMLSATALLPGQQLTFGGASKMKVVLVGVGIRGTTFWGRRIVENYSDKIEYVGLCDINPGRLAYAKKYIGVDCPTYLDFDEMLKVSNPDLVIVTTKDSTHHTFIIKGLDYGCDVLTEKPLTIDEEKCQDILDAERRSGKKVVVGFNYRWSPYMTKIKEHLHNKVVGKLTSVDFHWYLNTYHGASYFRRWHGQREAGGTLWLHKATHHFDLLNWWVNSEPVEVYAHGALEHYGKNGPFRGDKCRTCPHKSSCKYHFDITKSETLMNLYVDHEEHDGYIRDNCLYRDEINIYDKMSAQIKYANDVVVNYSLTTYSPFEGWRIAFNGHEGRMEAWEDIPYNDNIKVDQEALHTAEMNQVENSDEDHAPLIIHPLWKDHKVERVAMERHGHGGGDKRLHHKIFGDVNAADPLGRAAGLRDGAMSILIGIAARKSIESGMPIKIASLTDLDPREERF